MTHSNQTISPLRQRMIDDMSLRKLKPVTQKAYLRSVIKLCRFLARSPDTATAEDLREFQLHMAANGVSNKTINATLVLHTWGSAMTHHPHVHGIVPGGGFSADGQQWPDRTE